MEQSLDTKPSGALVAMSVLVIAGCVLLISAAMARFFVTWDPGSLIAGVILLPLPAALAVQQYRGTFRHSAQAAHMAAVLLFVADGFALFGFAATLGEKIIERGPIPWAPLMLQLLTIGVTCCLAAWMNLRWSQRLKFYAGTAQPRSARTRFSTRELLAAVATIAFTTALIGYFVRSTPPRYAENVTCDMAPFGLPESAQQVSFC